MSVENIRIKGPGHSHKLMQNSRIANYYKHSSNSSSLTIIKKNSSPSFEASDKHSYKELNKKKISILLESCRPFCEKYFARKILQARTFIFVSLVESPRLVSLFLFYCFYIFFLNLSISLYDFQTPFAQIVGLSLRNLMFRGFLSRSEYFTP